MKKYYVNTKAQTNGDHEVHKDDCRYMPSLEHRKYLGEFDNCDDAVKEAERSYSQSNGCKTCSFPCHTG